MLVVCSRGRSPTAAAGRPVPCPMPCLQLSPSPQCVPVLWFSPLWSASPCPSLPAGDQVWVKVVSKTGQRLGLAMRDVDQVTGEDLLPMQRSATGANAIAANPSGPLGAPQTALHGLSGIKVGWREAPHMADHGWALRVGRRGRTTPANQWLSRARVGPQSRPSGSDVTLHVQGTPGSAEWASRAS